MKRQSAHSGYAGPRRRSRGGESPALRDFLVIAAIVLIVDAIAAALLVYVYYPVREREAIARVPAQLTVLARDRQNALTGWVRERISDARLTSSRLTGGPGDAAVLEQFIRSYGYDSAFVVDDSGRVLLRLGSAETDAASVAAFVRANAGKPEAIDFVLLPNQRPKVFTTASANGRRVVYVSDPYEYVYPLFNTFTAASRTGETNLLRVDGNWVYALNPMVHPYGAPLRARSPLSSSLNAAAFRAGEKGLLYRDRSGIPVIAVAKQVAMTRWFLVAKVDREEAIEGAVAETMRLGTLIALASLLLGSLAFATLRSRRVHRLRIAEDQLARLYDNANAAIIVMRTILDDQERPVDHEVVDMNLTAEEIFDVSLTEEVGKRSADAPYLQWPPEVRAQNYEVAMTGTAIQYEQFSTLFGRWFDTRVFSPGYGQFAQVLTDITQRKATEETVRNLSAKLLRVQDDSQRRIARQLHETVAQSLAAIRMNLTRVRQTVAKEESAVALVDDVVSITDDAVSEIRTLSYLLHPPMIDEAGLVTALGWYAEGFEQRSGIETTLNAPEDPGRLSRDVETSVFRIVQECLTNVQRHSNATAAVITIVRDGDRLSVEVSDNGRGLAPALRDHRAAILSSGVGIAGINERVRTLDGELDIRSSDAGTTICVTLPV